MRKESNAFSISLLFSGALLFFVLTFLFSSSLFLALAVVLGGLGAIRWVNHFAKNPIVSWIHAMAFEFFAVSASFLLRPFGYVKKINQKSGPETGRPILLIHGYIQNASNWIYIKRFLSQKGLGPIYTLNLLPPFRSIRDFGDLVAQKAKEIAEETGSKELTLIGHSMGGLVSLWYAMKIASPGTVRQVITIGSPIAGTHLAKIAIGPNGREMERGSEFVQELGKELGKNSQIPLYHIGSKIDQITVPYSSSITGHHPEREYLVDDLGHMTLLVSSRVARKIEEWLKV